MREDRDVDQWKVLLTEPIEEGRLETRVRGTAEPVLPCHEKCRSGQNDSKTSVCHAQAVRRPELTAIQVPVNTVIGTRALLT